jgi:hypothetical protein
METPEKWKASEINNSKVEGDQDDGEETEQEKNRDEMRERNILSLT